jgi:cytochrome c-type biogenesis protein CcmH/NrfG/TolB-like protein
MLKKLTLLLLLSIFYVAANAQNNADNVLVLPFENTSGKPEFNWVGESFADSMADLLKVPGLNVVGNDERKVIQQRINVPLTTLPSLATSLKLARESKATLLIAGRYNIIPAQGDIAASLTVTAKIIRVNEGRFLSEELPDGRKITRDITLSDALANLQTIEGQMAYQVLYQRDKALPFSQNQFIESANKVPAKAFEAYIKGLLTSEADPKRENFLKNALRLYSETKEGETYSDAALELGHFYLYQKKTTEAIDNFSRIPQTDRHFPEAAFYTGLIYWSNGNYEQALAVMRPLADELKLTSVYNTLGAIAVQAARSEKKNKPKSAELLREGTEYLKKASDSQPDDPESRFNYGLALFVDGKFADAIKQIQPVLASNPRDGEAYYLLAKALEKTADASATDFDNQARRFLLNYAKVETDYRRGNSTDSIALRVEQPPRKDFVSVVMIKNQNPAIKSASDTTGELLAQAKQLYKDGRDDEAMAILRKVLNSEPMSSEAYLMLGKIHLRRTDMEQATSSLKTSLFWDNSQIDSYILLTRIFVEKKDCLTAKNYAEAANKIDGENQEVIGLQRLVERCGK